LIGRALCATLIVATLAVYPASAATTVTGSVSAVTWQGDGIITWDGSERRTISPQTLDRSDPALAPGTSKVVAHGAAGVLEVRVRYTQRDGGRVHRGILWSTVVQAPHPRIVADGIGHSPLTDFEAHGLARMAYMARGALEMIATAYSADCSGCGGMTALGRRAGYGIVAVDPRVIPIGTHLYIPGYGSAIAGDTGGDIVGNRIDLGFNTQRDEMLFGRRPVTVYRIK